MNVLGLSMVAIVAGTLVSAASSAQEQESARPRVMVYKTPTCGCCGKWVDHLRANGFEVTTRDLVDLTAIKRDVGVTAELSSCHTALVGGYVIEGHVPADVVHRLLEEQPKVAGIAVPGMPRGSPGMEGPYPPEAYDVIAFRHSGSSEVYTTR